MNKEELLRDLRLLQIQYQKIAGAIEYIVNKIRDVEKAEAEELEKSKIEKK